VVADIGLAAEAAAVRARDHADMRRGHSQHASERAMHVVRNLRRGPDRELAFAVDRADRGVLLDRQMRVAFEEEHVLEHVVGALERLFDVAERERLQPVDVALLAVVVDARLRRGRAPLRASDRRRSWYFTSIRSSASVAVCSSFAMTAATGSPT
jgi:hypothetical protein